jgi:hypothetical protein
LLRRVEAVHAVQEHGLAGAVRADEREDLAAAHLQADAAQGAHAPEGEVKIFHRQVRVATPDRCKCVQGPSANLRIL